MPVTRSSKKSPVTPTAAGSSKRKVATSRAVKASSPVDTKPKICSANEPYQSDDADFTLVSSDGWSFKVHTYQLMAASTVFRDMLCINILTPNTTDIIKLLELSDPHSELAWQIRRFLDFLYGKVKLSFDDSITKYLDTIHLLKKYDCETALKTYALAAESAMSEDATPDDIFIIAAHLDNVELCGKAIRRMGNWSWTEEDVDDSLQSHVLDSSPLDPTAMPEERIALIPHRYLCGLLRASRESEDGLVPGIAEWEAVAEEFERLMKLKKKKVKSRKRSRESEAGSGTD